MDRFIRLPEIKKITGYGKTTIYDMIKNDEFPKQTKLRKNGRAVGWVESEVKEWYQSRVSNNTSP